MSKNPRSTIRIFTIGAAAAIGVIGLVVALALVDLAAIFDPPTDTTVLASPTLSAPHRA